MPGINNYNRNPNFPFTRQIAFVKFRNFGDYIFIKFQQISSRLCKFTDFKPFFPAMLTDFC